MNRVNVFKIHRCTNDGYGLIQIFTEKIRISPTKLWRVCNLNGDNGGHSDGRLSQNREKATSQNGDSESLYVYGL